MRVAPIIAIAAILAVPADAAACGTCVFAVFDRVLPPAGWWFVWALAWFAASAAVLTISKDKLRPQPRLPWAAALTAVAVFGSSFIGPAFGFALVVLPAAAFVLAWRGEPRPAKRRLRLVGAAALVVAMGLGARSYLVLSTRTEGDYVVRWQGTDPAHQIFEYLAADPVRHEAELRKIALLGSGELAAKAKAILESR